MNAARIARRTAITVAASLTSAALVFAFRTDTPTVCLMAFISTILFAFFAAMEADR